jgi:hypothetical protein
MADRVAEIFGRMSRPTESASGATENEESSGERAIVEIVKKGKVVHRDPAPIPMAGGRVYREYVIPGGSASSDDIDPPAPAKPPKAARATTNRAASRATTRRKR